LTKDYLEQDTVIRESGEKEEEGEDLAGVGDRWGEGGSQIISKQDEGKERDRDQKKDRGEETAPQAGKSFQEEGEQKRRGKEERLLRGERQTLVEI